MTDVGLRELERRWLETQALEDEVAYLLERVRVNALSPEKLGLAAYFGHEASRQAAVSLGVVQDSETDDERWIAGLERFGHEGVLRTLLAVVRSESFPRPPMLPGSHVEQIVCEVERRVLDPRHELALAGRPAPEGDEPGEQDEESLIRIANAHNVISILVAAVEAGPTAASSGSPQWNAARSRSCGRLAHDALQICLFVVPGLVRDHAFEEVVGWALGRRDPLRERVREQAS